MRRVLSFDIIVQMEWFTSVYKNGKTIIGIDCVMMGNKRFEKKNEQHSGKENTLKNRKENR